MNTINVYLFVSPNLNFYTFAFALIADSFTTLVFKAKLTLGVLAAPQYFIGLGQEQSVKWTAWDLYYFVIIFTRLSIECNFLSQLNKFMKNLLSKLAQLSEPTVSTPKHAVSLSLWVVALDYGMYQSELHVYYFKLEFVEEVDFHKLWEEIEDWT